MEQSRYYTIFFTYEIAEDAIKFHLQADVTIMSANTFFINNIRIAGKTSGSLIPPISLIKHKDQWIYTDSKKETTLSLAIGHAIENHARASTSME